MDIGIIGSGQMLETLYTVSVNVMIDPALLGAETDIFVAGTTRMQRIG